MDKIFNYIDGQLVPSKSNKWIENVEPATGQTYSLIPDSDHEDVELAFSSAEEAFKEWSQKPVQERSDIMLKISSLIEENKAFLAEAESRDNGKPVGLAKTIDIPRAASNMKFFATGILHYASESHQLNDVAINYTLRKPIGVVGCISPWNLPLYLFTWKIAPALAAGNTVVAKPSEITPMTAFLFSEICIEAGLPKGVLNIVHGYGPKVGAPITEHKGIKAISFTGGTKTGEQIAKVAAPMFKKLSLELGGKNPNIIFDDCNFDKAVSTSVLSSFANQGQICLCGSRIFVQEKIYEKFKAEFVKKVQNLTIGDPKNKDTKIGALVSKDHIEKVQSYIELAKQEGGTILTGGKIVSIEGRCKKGYFLEPTVIEGLSYDCRTNQEEIFGPVVTLNTFQTEDEVLMYANSTPYGLSSTVWTENITKANRMSKALDAGIVWVNCWLVRDLRTPFGGVKNSGVGREGGFNAFNFFTEQTNVCISY
ncbi:MAG: aldehyde dehydrogenase [Flavobacteriales bacterium]|nr:aldehyde dehydrogenase [Flavobacteriales bacterium]